MRFCFRWWARPPSSVPGTRGRSWGPNSTSDPEPGVPRTSRESHTEAPRPILDRTLEALPINFPRRPPQPPPRFFGVDFPHRPPKCDETGSTRSKPERTSFLCPCLNHRRNSLDPLSVFFRLPRERKGSGSTGTDGEDHDRSLAQDRGTDGSEDSSVWDPTLRERLLLEQGGSPFRRPVPPNKTKERLRLYGQVVEGSGLVRSLPLVRPHFPSTPLPL